MAEFKEQKRSLAIEKIDEGESVSEDDLPDVEQPLRDLIDRVVPGISLIGVVENNDNYQLKFQNRMEEEIELENLSSGEIDIITMLFFVAEQQIEARLREYSEDDSDPEDDTVVLIDGPESYLHPYLQLQFIDFLDEYLENRPDIQIILVTHSEVILNQTPDENLWYLVYPDMASGNQLHPAKDIELNLLQNILGEIGTSAITAGNPLLLVEGDSDREILIRMFPELRDSMTILPMKGKQKIVSLDDIFDKLVPNFLKSGIHLHAIVDRDRGSSDFNSNHIHELPVTNMENVLLQPKPLYETIQSLADSRRLERSGINGPNDVESFLHDLISQESIKKEELRLHINDEMEFQFGMSASEKITTETVINRFEEVVSSNKERISDTFERKEREIEAAAKNNELEEFDGKRIISKFASEFDLQVDSVRLLTAENIQRYNSYPKYMKDIIDDIKSDIDT